jgi:hypothetical protein
MGCVESGKLTLTACRDGGFIPFGTETARLGTGKRYFLQIGC